jgi:DNA-binding NarL/FixJ family response regulator
MSIKVLIADDQELVRAGFRLILETDPDLHVVAEAVDGAQAIEATRRARPEIVLMDIRMPVMDGLEATRRIVATKNPPRVLMLTTFDLDEYVFGALRAGASGFLLKDTLPADLITAIRVVAAGEALLAPSVTRRLISEFARTPPLGTARPAAPAATATPPGAGLHADKVTALLTYRECEVLHLVTAGLSNAEIADHLHISPATAKTHVAHLLTKLDARDRVQLVIIAYQCGLATPQ